MIHHTINETTVTKGQAIATVIADSVSFDGARITTLELVYPRYIHAEFMTHRMFSRNSSSSRATPLSVTLEEVKFDPALFDYVGKNQTGMVAGEELSLQEQVDFLTEWHLLGRAVAEKVKQLSDKYDVHKQTLNRALEPWLRIRTLVTATEWDNFFDLRISSQAQPEINSLARAMQEAMSLSKAMLDNEVHLPYITKEEHELRDKGELDTVQLIKIAVARCARVSYARLDGRENSIQDDIALAEMLRERKHASPFEHIAYSNWDKAIAKDEIYANFKGWRSYRHIIGL